MKDWKEYLPTFKEFFNTLAGKLTAILAFALLVIIILSCFGAEIPPDYRLLVYIVVIGAMLVSTYQAFLQAKREQISVASDLLADTETEVQKPHLDSQKDMPLAKVSLPRTLALIILTI